MNRGFEVTYNKYDKNFIFLFFFRTFFWAIQNTFPIFLPFFSPSKRFFTNYTNFFQHDSTPPFFLRGNYRECGYPTQIQIPAFSFPSVPNPDETSDDRVEFVPPTLGTDYLINQVDTGISDLSTLMRPVSMDLVIDYSKNKKFMPPKATWFEPKPLDGLFFYNIIDWS